MTGVQTCALPISKELYFNEVELGKKELLEITDWEVPQTINYNDSYIQKDVILSIMEPFFQRSDASQPEKDFIDFLEVKSTEIDWWFKNGERDGTFFAAPYNEGEDEKPFYVDFLVKFRDGRLGLFDTKAGLTLAAAKTRAEGLAKYIAEENLKGLNYFGGIIVKQPDGSWRYNDQRVFDHTTAEGWKLL